MVAGAGNDQDLSAEAVEVPEGSWVAMTLMLWSTSAAAALLGRMASDVRAAGRAEDAPSSGLRTRISREVPDSLRPHLCRNIE